MPANFARLETSYNETFCQLKAVFPIRPTDLERKCDLCNLMKNWVTYKAIFLEAAPFHLTSISGRTKVKKIL